jgi:hypothetical protein
MHCNFLSDWIWDKETCFYELYLKEIIFIHTQNPVFQTSCNPKCSLGVFLVFELQVIATCFSIEFSSSIPCSMNSIFKRSYSSTQHARIFKTKCKPNCSLWVFSNFLKLVCNFQMVTTCFLIEFATIWPGSIKSSSKRSYSSTQNSSIEQSSSNFPKYVCL